MLDWFTTAWVMIDERPMFTISLSTRIVMRMAELYVSMELTPVFGVRLSSAALACRTALFCKLACAATHPPTGVPKRSPDAGIGRISVTRT